MTANTPECCNMTKTVPTNAAARVRTRLPRVDIVEDTNGLTIVADMPGVDPGALDIHFENGGLSVRAAQKANEPNDRRALFSEYTGGEFARNFRVSEMIDGEGISAEYKHGVLTLRLPKLAAAKPRKVLVNGN